MSREYEIVYVFDSALEETQVTEHLDRFHELLKNPENPNPVTSVSHWGKRTLSYPIKGKEQGYYVLVRFETDPTLLPEFERAIKLEDSALRHLIVVNEALPVPVTSDAVADKTEIGEAQAGPTQDESLDEGDD